MDGDANLFDSRVEEWQEHQDLPWGRLLYGTSHLNIGRHLDGRSLHVLDVGGGTGVDALYYAGLGHTVTLVDCSPAMLDAARRAAGEQGLLGRMRILEGDAGALPDLLGDERFDLVLCHMMIEFVAVPGRLLATLPRQLAPNGLLSVIDTNRYAEVYRHALRLGDLSAAAEAIGLRGRVHPWVDRPTPCFSAGDVIRALRAGGGMLVGQYGIRTLCDLLPNERKVDPVYFAGLEALEHQLTNVYPYYLVARLFQVIVRRA